MLRIFLLMGMWMLQPALAAGQPAILVVGDSLSAGYGMDVEDGWVALLEHRLTDSGHEYRVVNASQSGATSRGALSLLPRALAAHRPEIVIIEIGGNDGLRGLPVSQLRRNLEAMIGLSREAGAHVIIPAIRIPPNYGAAYTNKFRQTYDEVSAGGAATLVSQFLEKVALDEKLMQDDGVHPNEKAQPILLDVIWTALEPLLEPAHATAPES